MNLLGSIVPMQEIARPEESRGTLIAAYREKITRKGSTWSGTGPLDLNILPALLNLFVKNLITPTTPTSGILTRDWTFLPTLTTDDLRSCTAYWGDPGSAVYQTVYTMGSELVITSDVSGTDVAMIDASGFGRFPTDLVTAPAVPAHITTPLIAPANMQAWVDAPSAIGTTALTAGLISVKHTIPTGVVPKYFATGTSSDLSFTRHGRQKRMMVTEVEVEQTDLTLWTLYEAGTPIKLRVIHNGPFIETVAGPLTYYSHLMVDTYGLIRNWSWGDMDGANRTASFTVESAYDATLGADWQMQVRNARATL